jgi:hypothetical protein
MLSGVVGEAARSLLLDLQPQRSAAATGLPVSPLVVDIPIFPLFVALVGLVAIVLVSIGALKLPKFPTRAPGARPKPTAAVASVEVPVAPAPAPVYKKAPIQVHFPMIKSGFPDVWGVREKAIMIFRVEDRALATQRELPGLTATIGGNMVPLVFYKGEARLERTFNAPQDVVVQIELRVKGEKTPRRTTRVLRVVDYREEIAELFARFKDDASSKVTPIRHDATAWEVHDSLLDAKPDLSKAALRQVVSSFEEAKFSNHPVGRPTYEKMVGALRVLNIVEV